MKNYCNIRELLLLSFFQDGAYALRRPLFAKNLPLATFINAPTLKQARRALKPLSHISVFLILHKYNKIFDICQSLLYKKIKVCTLGLFPLMCRLCFLILCYFVKSCLSKAKSFLSFASKVSISLYTTTFSNKSKGNSQALTTHFVEYNLL